jgi:hypothetical protein
VVATGTRFIVRMRDQKRKRLAKTKGHWYHTFVMQNSLRNCQFRFIKNAITWLWTFFESVSLPQNSITQLSRIKISADVSNEVSANVSEILWIGADKVTELTLYQQRDSEVDASELKLLAAAVATLKNLKVLVTTITAEDFLSNIVIDLARRDRPSLGELSMIIGDMSNNASDHLAKYLRQGRLKSLSLRRRLRKPRHLTSDHFQKVVLSALSENKSVEKLVYEDGFDNISCEINIANLLKKKRPHGSVKSALEFGVH